MDPCKSSFTHQPEDRHTNGSLTHQAKLTQGLVHSPARAQAHQGLVQGREVDGTTQVGHMAPAHTRHHACTPQLTGQRRGVIWRLCTPETMHHAHHLPENLQRGCSHRNQPEQARQGLSRAEKKRSTAKHWRTWVKQPERLRFGRQPQLFSKCTHSTLLCLQTTVHVEGKETACVHSHEVVASGVGSGSRWAAKALQGMKVHGDVSEVEAGAGEAAPPYILHRIQHLFSVFCICTC
eukprot:1160383-Pelagomonas_calceolata.AAC.9